MASHSIRVSPDAPAVSPDLAPQLRGVLIGSSLAARLYGERVCVLCRSPFLMPREVVCGGCRIKTRRSGESDPINSHSHWRELVDVWRFRLSFGLELA